MIWLLILILIVFIPFPIYIFFEYIDNKPSIYLYKFKIYPSARSVKNIEKAKSTSSFSKKVYLNVFKKVYEKSQHIISKSTLYLEINLSYGLEDAFVTGILYGIIQSILSIVYRLFSYVFKIKKFKTNIKPVFNDTVLTLTLKSIFFINIAKIIYICLMTLIYVKKETKLYLKLKEAY